MIKPSICVLFVLLGLFSVSAYSEEGEEPSFDIPTLQDLPLDNLLSFGYYQKTCPDFEGIVQRKIKQWIKKDYSVGPSLLRLHFHDCAVTGCDASILLDHEGSERRAPASRTLKAFDLIDDIKAEIEKKCPHTVSCTDILTAATRDATVLIGGPYWMIPYGRKDSKTSYASDADSVPSGRRDVTSLLELFQSFGLNVLDLVVLSGAHTIGRATCGSIQYRLYNFNGTEGGDPSLDDRYLDFLQRKCRWASEYVELDGTTPKTFDAEYYKNLQKHKGLLSTDQMLFSDPRTYPLVAALAEQPSVFHDQFAVSMTKLGNIQVLTEEDDGEVRKVCSRSNANSY